MKVGAPSQAKQLRVLIVDDEQDFVEILSMRLEASGAFSVAKAFDGEAGLQKARSFKPHVVLLDLLMPKLDGWELCQRLRSEPETRNIPLVVITAVRTEEAQARARAMGIRRILFKPFDYRQLVELLKGTLPNHAPRPGLSLS